MDTLEIKEFMKERLSSIYEIMSSYEPLVKVTASRAVIIGDLHGDLDTLLRIISEYPPSDWKYVMLGDYVDRGQHQVETLYLAFKLLLEHGAVLLRGNHESPLTNYEYGFYIELLRKFGPYDGDSLYDRIKDVFSQMPVAAILNDEYFLVHGGLPINNVGVDDIMKLPKPDEIPNNEITFQLLWNDPSDDVKEYEPNVIRGPGTYVFGPAITERFLSRGGFKMLVRGHEYVPEGYRWNHGGKVLTIFTSTAGPYSGTKAHIAVLNNGTLNLVEVVPRPSS